ncbi:MAG: hypothetical protein ACRD18_17525 [Terriglobia bacterium]
MSNSSDEARLAELRQTGEAIGKLAKDEAAFGRAAEAFRAGNAEQYQSELSKLGLLPFCVLICRWFCSKHCVLICSKLCREPLNPQDITVAEMREFALVTERLTKDEALLKRFLDAVDHEQADVFSKLLAEVKWQRFCHQLCHLLCSIRCRRVCKILCPPGPMITEVGLIPTSQIDSTGRAAGPSLPPGPTPSDNKPAGVGDHPFGGWANVKGVFNVTSPFQYKVSFATALGGPWTPILQAITDYHWCHGGPLINYSRVPDVNGWYNVADMDCDGQDYLTDWSTPPDRDKLYYLKLTVRNAALIEFESSPVPVRVDNGSPLPAPPMIDLQLQLPDGTRRKLGCCETVQQGKGNLVVITLQAWDENFSSISVALLGGCNASYSIVDTGGMPLSKTYNGNTADTGYPVATEFLWDPWKSGISPCCYLIDVRINDRVIASNYWSGGHVSEGWHSITIA